MRNRISPCPLLCGIAILLCSLSGCAEKQLDKQIQAHQAVADAENAAAIAASKADDHAAVVAHLAAVDAEKKVIADLELKRKAAHDADSEAWTGGVSGVGSLTNIVLPGSAAIVAVLGTLVTQIVRKKTFRDGETNGAAEATTAITNADTQNVLQAPLVQQAVLANLAESAPHIASAVSAKI